MQLFCNKAWGRAAARSIAIKFFKSSLAGESMMCYAGYYHSARPRQELYTSLGTTWSLNDYAIEKVTIDSKRPQVQRRISVPWTGSTAKARSTVGAQSTGTRNPNGRGDTVRRQIPQRHLRRYRKRVVTKRGGRLGVSESPTPD